MLSDTILLTVELVSKSESVLTHPAAALSTRFTSYSKAFGVISPIFIASSAGGDSISRNHFLCAPISSSSSSVNVLLQDGSNSVPSSGSTSSSSSLAVSTTSAVPSSTEVLNPLKSSVRVAINFFQTLLMLVF